VRLQPLGHLSDPVQTTVINNWLDSNSAIARWAEFGGAQSVCERDCTKTQADIGGPTSFRSLKVSRHLPMKI
jgi:hypothetical protein